MGYLAHDSSQDVNIIAALSTNNSLLVHNATWQSRLHAVSYCKNDKDYHMHFSLSCELSWDSGSWSATSKVQSKSYVVDLHGIIILLRREQH